MNEDPTRRMDAPEPDDAREPRGGFSTRSKALIAVLVAAVIGLGVAVAVIASGDGDDGATVTEAAPAGGEPTTEPTEPTTEPTTTDTTTTDTTTTETDPSGGTEAP